MAAHQAPAMQLRDIKPPVPINDMSLYFYWGVVILCFVVLIAALFFLFKTLVGMRSTNRRKSYLAALKQIDWHDPKKGAYRATRLGRLILGDDERLKELYRQMVTELETYKYKKVVEPIRPKARARFNLFVKACDESL